MGIPRVQSLLENKAPRRCSGTNGPTGEYDRIVGGGGSGIRTHDTVSRIHAFQASAFSHSAIPPGAGNVQYSDKVSSDNPRSSPTGDFAAQLMRLFAAENFGKQLLKIADPR